MGVISGQVLACVEPRIGYKAELEQAVCSPVEHRMTLREHSENLVKFNRSPRAEINCSIRVLFKYIVLDGSTEPASEGINTVLRIPVRN